MFVDNAGESDVVDDPSSFVITEEKADEAHVQTSLLKGDADAEGEAMKGTQENSDESNVSTSLLEKTKAAGDASDSIPEIIDAEDDEGRIGKLTLEEYLLQPVDSSSVRQSISAQHLFRRRTVVNEDILAGSGTMPGSRQNPDIIINEEELQLDKIDIDAAESIANDVPTPLSFASSASSPIRVGTGDELELEKEIPHEDGIVEEDIQRNLHQIKTGLRSLQGHMERLEATRPSSSGDSPEAQLLDTLRSSLLEISSLTNEILGLPQSTDADSFNAALEKYSDMLVGMVQRKLQG
ncbi:hypothetical protein BC829DRAFT_23582 [Chytridium lagenaria]|nr:hypothetical protein BC829DRAFT_23582 [Chytridium lagenaria]